MTRIDRRAFLGAAGSAVLAAGSAWGRPVGANERVRLGVIGTRGRGAELAGAFAKRSDAAVVSLCDVDDASFAPALKAVEKAGCPTPRVEKDFRRLLDDREVDAVVVATPDHWHALMTVMACQAGKDVYTEKPASHNVVEGRRMVEAARKYKRVVQMGIQRRSMPHVQDAVSHVKQGGIGTVGMARAWIFKERLPIGPPAPAPVPAGVDYAMWQGPAPDRPFVKNHFHYNWHWFWNWGTGELGNNGIHGLDVARWGLGVDAPLTVASTGGNYVYRDREVPDTQIVTWEFPGACLVWEHRLWDRQPLGGQGFAIAFYGDKGVLTVDEDGWKVEGGAKAGGKASAGLDAHLANFVDSMRSRATPNADIEVGHLSTRLCHLGNISQRVGRKLHFDASTESFPSDPEANALLAREYSPRFEMPTHV